jgi:hypothetical protein
LREEEERRRITVVRVGKKTTEGIAPPYRTTGHVIGGPAPNTPRCHSVELKQHA